VAVIAARLAAVRARIGEACARAGRDAASVTLVAVSKGQSADAVRAAYEAGQRDFGENYAQEWREKADALARACPELRWHFVGRVQTNKAKYLAGRVALVHTVDRVELARELGKRASAAGVRVAGLVEVNVGGEAQKAGVTPDALDALLGACAGLDALDLRGLMCIPPEGTPDETRPHFRRLRELLAAANASRPPRLALTELSMGMSADYEAAVEEGATLVRVGTAIFGPRR
jgi:hypothetical protein